MAAAEDFVSELRLHAIDAAVEDLVANLQVPAGRMPAESVIKLAHWWATQGAADRDVVRQLLKEAARATAFGILAIIDGVRATSLGFERFEVAGIQGDDRTVINQSAAGDLHDLLAP